MYVCLGPRTAAGITISRCEKARASVHRERAPSMSGPRGAFRVHGNVRNCTTVAPLPVRSPRRENNSGCNTSEHNAVINVENRVRNSKAQKSIRLFFKRRLVMYRTLRNGENSFSPLSVRTFKLQRVSYRACFNVHYRYNETRVHFRNVSTTEDIQVEVDFLINHLARCATFRNARFAFIYRGEIFREILPLSGGIRTRWTSFARLSMYVTGRLCDA